MAQTIPLKVGQLDLLLETTVVHAAGTQPMSAAERATDKVSSAFDRAQAAIEEIAVITAATIERAAKRAAAPESVELEFGLKVSVHGDVVVAGVSAEASFKVTLKYRAAPNTATEPSAGIAREELAIE